MTSLVIIIALQSMDSITELTKAALQPHDIIELRLDYLASWDLDLIQACMNTLPQRIILTLRCQHQGGVFTNDIKARQHKLWQLATLKPDYLDVEFDIDNSFVSKLKRLSPETTLIRSYHNFKQTPPELQTQLDTMKHPDIGCYKIVTQANSSLDSLRLMQFIQQQSNKLNIAGHCMGQLGAFSRLSAPIINSHFLYTTVDNQSVLDFIPTVNELEKTYDIRNKNTKTKLYALIGNPITHSIGHQFHNDQFRQQQTNALYVKIQLTKNEVGPFFKLFPDFNAGGLSITMPLKQSIAVLFNQPQTTPINTIRFDHTQPTYTNTDGIGAIRAIENITPLTDKRILLLGAGGTAHAICLQLSKHASNITIANRSNERLNTVKQIHPSLDTVLFAQTTPTQHYDIIISTLPIEAWHNNAITSWLSPLLKHSPLILDANYNHTHNPLIALCQKNQCQLITGDHLFYHQARAQQIYWQQK